MRTRPADQLRREVAGEVVLPDDPAYQTLRGAFVHSGEPAVIVRCAGPADVAVAIRHARTGALPISVRSGGHSPAGFGTNHGGMLIDVSPIRTVDVLDPAGGLIQVGAGASWLSVAVALEEHQLAISSGDTTSVGVGGLLLGGGIGWLVRRTGLAIDSLVAAELVTADGTLVRASAGENAELFWAIRGGGGNFGVAVSFDMLAHRLPGVFFGKVGYPMSEAAAVLRRWRDQLRVAPLELTTFAYLSPSFGGGPVPAYVAACYAGDEPAVAQPALAPLRRLGTLLEDDIAPMPYRGVLAEPGKLPPGLVPRVKNRFVNVLSDQLIDELVRGVEDLGSLYVEIRSMGGAVASIPPDATAFAHRGSEALVMTVLLDLGAAAEAKFADLWAGLDRHITGGAYGNFLSTADAEDVAAMYPPATHARLAAVKARYDPGNLFAHNHNIVPAVPLPRASR